MCNTELKSNLVTIEISQITVITINSYPIGEYHMIEDQTVLWNMSAQDNTSSNINQNRSDIKLVEFIPLFECICDT